MPAFCAAWIVPISEPPIRHGAVQIGGQLISAVIRHALPAGSSTDLGHVAVLPGLVNAHTHLELSWLRNRIPPQSRFTDWVREVIRLRRGEDPALVDEAVPRAIEELHACGTAVVGDISNTLASTKWLIASRLSGVVFREAIGFQSERAEDVVSLAVADLEAVSWTDSVRAGLAAHAPYSVSPRAFERIARHAQEAVTTVHLAESREEVEFVRTGGGSWRTLLAELQAWDPTWSAPACGPVEYVDRLGYLGPRTLAVHGVQATDDDLVRLRDRGTTLVTCPRSNAWTGAGTPPIAAFFGSGVRVAIGTDSLASAPDLNLFEELAAARRLAPHVPARDLLRAATLNGAAALGFGADYGSIEPGKRAALIAVSLPPGLDDVEEYLVSGISPDRVSWLADF